MKTRNNLVKTSALVESILKRDRKARNSDSYLYLKVLCSIAKDRNDIEIENVTIINFLLNMTDWGFPPFESVRRARQKLQRKYPELSGNEAVTEARTKNENIYREFAKG